VEFSLGGSDDGSGVVILLELLSNLINDLTVTFSDVHLIVLFTGAEEISSQGAKAFITNHIWRSDIRYFINIDASNCNEKASLNRMIPSQVFFTLYIYLVIFVYFSLLSTIVGSQDHVPMCSSSIFINGLN
jgi:Zn-dependent M28 family amino/carboxypeptidase